MLLLFASLFFTTPAPLEMPRAEAYLVSDGSAKRLEDRFLRVDLWTARTVVGRWLDDDGRVFTLSRLETHPPAVSAEGTVTRSAYASETVRFDARKVLKDGAHAAAFKDAVRRLSPVDAVGDGVPPRQLPRRFDDVDYLQGTNESVIVCAFLPQDSRVWRLAVWELAPGDDFAGCVKAFEREFLEKDYPAFAESGRDKELPRPSRVRSRDPRPSERELLRADARHSVAAYDGWHVTDGEEFTVLDDLPSGGSFIDALTNELSVMRREYAKALPTPLDGSNVLSVARIFADRGDYLDALAVDGLTNMAWTAAYWSPSRREIVACLPDGGYGLLLRTFRHEAFHQYLSYATSMISASPWLNEGYAEYFEDVSSSDWGLPVPPGPEDIERFAALLPGLFAMDYAAFYDGTDEERRFKYRLAWSVAVFIEKGMRKVRNDPFETFKADYMSALLETRDMFKATQHAFRDKDRMEHFIVRWREFWSER